MPEELRVCYNTLPKVIEVILFGKQNRVRFLDVSY